MKEEKKNDFSSYKEMNITTRTNEQINSINANTTDNKSMKYDQSNNLPPRTLKNINISVVTNAMGSTYIIDAIMPSSSTERKIFEIF